MSLKEYSSGRLFLGNLPEGSDLLTEIEKFARDNKLDIAVVELIGAVTEAHLGYFDSERREYIETTFNKQMEILSGFGNISLRDGRPVVHLHLVVGDREGRAFGGHVLPGTKVFVAEVLIKEVKGDLLERKYNPKTGLALWNST